MYYTLNWAVIKFTFPSIFLTIDTLVIIKIHAIDFFPLKWWDTVLRKSQFNDNIYFIRRSFNHLPQTLIKVSYEYYVIDMRKGNQ